MSSRAASNFHCCPFEEKAEPLSEDKRLEIRLNRDVFREGARKTRVFEVLHGNQRTVHRPLISIPFIPSVCPSIVLQVGVTTPQCSSVCREGEATHCQLS